MRKELFNNTIFQRMESHDRKPAFGFQMRSAASSARTSSPSSSFTAMRSAWNVRVAG